MSPRDQKSTTAQQFCASNALSGQLAHSDASRVDIPEFEPLAQAEGMLAYMKRTTIKLPDDVDAKLRHEAERRGVTVSELTREAVEVHLGGREHQLRAAGAGRSGRDDISERIEEILAAEVAK
jgi:predicted transcriptional regulator